METNIILSRREVSTQLRRQVNVYAMRMVTAISVAIILLAVIIIGSILVVRYTQTLKAEILDLRHQLESQTSWYQWAYDGMPAYPEEISVNIPMEELEEVLEKSAPEIEPEIVTKPYDGVNLDADLQTYVIKRCAEVGYPCEILFAMQRKESNSNPIAVGVNTNGTKDYGLWQINSSNFAGIARHFSMSEAQVREQISDPYFNLECALYILQESEKNHPDNWNTLLMCYNMGGGNAKVLWNQGIYSSSYSRTVIRYAVELGWTDPGYIHTR